MVKIEFEEGSEYKWAVNSIIAITKTNSRTRIKISNKTNSKIKNKTRKIITLTIKKTTKTIFKKKTALRKWYAPQKLDTFGGAYFYGKERTKI